MRHLLARIRKYRPKVGYSLSQMAAAGLGSFAGIAIVAYLSLDYNLELLVPSFGASAVLLYAASHVPMAQPRNVLGGHLISAFVGVTVYQLLGYSWWSLAFGVSLAILAMMVTDTTHPPGGATAFAAVFTHQDYSFIFTPVAAGVIILIAVALLVHNFNGQQKYPHAKTDKKNFQDLP